MANSRNNQTFSTLSSTKYDVIVIGAGVVGCAIARHFTLQGVQVLIIEKGADILDGASKGNSAILHTGFDVSPNSLEHACIVDGYNEFLRIRSKLNLPLLETGALVLAWNQNDANKLDKVLEQTCTNGIDGARLLTAKEILAREPRLSTHVKGGVYIPKECVIDPWTTPYAYILQAVENGARLIRGCEVLNGEFDGYAWKLVTTQGTVHGTCVINCAGLYGDLVDAKLINKTSFRIYPRKGQFLVYDKPASRLINSIILTIPNETTKGIVVCRTIFGNVLVGPTSESQDSRHDVSVNTSVLQKLRQKGERLLPSLAHHSVIATYAGIRPATEFKDYCIQPYTNKNYISVGGIRSTGLSAALGIARYVFNQYTQFDNRHTALAKYSWPSVSPLAEHETRDWQNQGNEGIACHCELVTRREIQQALSGEIPVASLDGLKRRTRVTMGRCQGFYCYAQLSELTQGCFAKEITLDKGNG